MSIRSLKFFGSSGGSSNGQNNQNGQWNSRNNAFTTSSKLDPVLEEKNDRMLGCWLGQATGDSFGSRYEFERKSKVLEMLEKDYDKKQRLIPILGGGPFKLRPGQVTDDTELAYCLGSSLLSGENYYKPIYAATNYVKWFNSGPFDAGKATSNSFSTKSFGDSLDKVVQMNAQKNIDSLSNGHLMRICPLAICGSSYSLPYLLNWTEQDGLLSHPNEISINASKAFVAALYTAIHTGNVSKTVQAALSIACEPVKRMIQRGIDGNKKFYVYKEERGDPRERGPEEKEMETDITGMGYLGIALQNAFYEVCFSKSFERSMERTVSLGGDTDTNAAIAGTLLGALMGRKAIPREWEDTVTQCEQRYIASGDKFYDTVKPWLYK